MSSRQFPPFVPAAASPPAPCALRASVSLISPPIHPISPISKEGIAIYQFEILLSGKEADFSHHWGSVLHGVLIQMLPPAWQEELHSRDTRMLTQWVEPLQKGQALWHIQALEEGLAEAVAEALAEQSGLWCRHAHLQLMLEDIRAKKISLSDTIDQAFGRNAKGVILTVCTPAAHKVDGRYESLPSIGLVGRSIARRITAVAPDFVLADEEALGQVLGACRLGRFQLRSSTFQLEGHYIPAYLGQMEIRFHGSMEENALADVLFSLAPMTGIGVKTTVGMGGCKAEMVP